MLCQDNDLRFQIESSLLHRTLATAAKLRSWAEPSQECCDFKARFEDLFYGCRRLSTHGCGASCLHTSGTGRRDFLFIYLCDSFFFPHVHFSRTAGGRTGLPGALYSRLRRLLYTYMRNGRVSNLFWCVSTFFFFPMYISPGLRGGNQVAGGSLLTGAAILIRIQQAEREGGEFVLVCFNNVIPCSRATGGGPGCRRLSTHGCGDFDSHITSRTRGYGICFGLFQQCYSMFPGCVEGAGCRRLSTHSCGDFSIHKRDGRAGAR